MGKRPAAASELKSAAVATRPNGKEDRIAQDFTVNR